jgi:hypothetical protein
MKIIVPMTIDDSALSASSLTEDDHPEWDVATTYATGDQVISATSHRIYSSVIDSNLGIDPTSDDGSNWTTIGATNKWKPFDNKIADKATDATQITYGLTPDSNVTALSMHGLVADSATVQVVTQGDEVTVYDETKSLIDNSGVEDWWDYFFQPIDRLEELVFTDMLAFAGDAVSVQIDISSGNVEVGEIVMGYEHRIGVTLSGVDLGITDYSIKDTDDFGNAYVVERSYATTVDFPASIKTLRSAFIQRLLASRRASPTVYFADSDMEAFGTIAFGYFNDFVTTLEAGDRSMINIKVESLT